MRYFSHIFLVGKSFQSLKIETFFGKMLREESKIALSMPKYIFLKVPLAFPISGSAAFVVSSIEL